MSDIGMDEDRPGIHGVFARGLALLIQNPDPLFRETGLIGAGTKI